MKRQLIALWIVVVAQIIAIGWLFMRQPPAPDAAEVSGNDFQELTEQQKELTADLWILSRALYEKDISWHPSVN